MAVGVTQLGGEINVTPSGPCAEILFTKQYLLDRNQAKTSSGFPMFAVPDYRPQTNSAAISP